MTNPDDIKNKAAQVRANAGSDAKKAKTIQIVGGLVVAAFVVGIIGVGFYAKNQSQTDVVVPEAITEYDTSAALPKGVNASEGYGVPVGKQDPSAPRAELYEDFQCPACGQFEVTNAKNVFASAEKGEINLTLHPMIFLDRNFPESKLSSLRATMAWGCAVDAGKTIEYHSGIFAMQPAREGDGYSDEQLLDLAKKVIQISNSNSQITFKSYDEAYGRNFEDMIRRVPDLSLIKSLIGWTPKKSITDIIQDVIKDRNLNL